MCFDKTGTLTTIDIDIFGYLKVEKNSENQLYFKNVIADEDYYKRDLEETLEDEKNKMNDIIFHLFSTCHGAYLINNEVMGDPLDVKMLEFSGYNI